MPSLDSSSFLDPDYHLSPPAVDVVASGITAWADDIRPLDLDGLEGFEAVRGRRRFGLRVSEDGATIRFEKNDDFEGGIGAMLHRFGLTDPGAEAGSADPVVVETLARLPSGPLAIMRSMPDFGTPALEVLAGLPEGAPFLAFVRDLPALASEVESFLNDVVIEEDGTPIFTDADRERMVFRDPDPLGVYVSIVRGWFDHAWPHLDVSDERIREVAVSAGKVVALEDLGLLPWHVGFFATGPDEAVPKDPAAMASAIRFVERWTSLFSSETALSPEGFHAEFRERHGLDWTGLRRSFDAAGFTGHPSVSSLDVGTAVVRELARSVVDDPDTYEGDSLTMGIGRRVLARAAEGRGPSDLLSAWARWTTYDVDDGRDDADWLGLAESGLVPADLAGLSARDLIEAVGIDAGRVLDLFAEERDAYVEADGRLSPFVDGDEADGPSF